MCGTTNIGDVAKFFLSKCDLTHKKLQKLCYYAQAWHLANYQGEPLFQSLFEAWVHGPVAPDLYSTYQSWGWHPIAQRFGDDNAISDEKIRDYLHRVFQAYGKYSEDELEAITRSEFPWQEARNGISPSAYCRNPISETTMRNYYGKRIGKV